MPRVRLGAIVLPDRRWRGLEGFGGLPEAEIG